MCTSRSQWAYPALPTLTPHLRLVERYANGDHRAVLAAFEDRMTSSLWPSNTSFEEEQGEGFALEQFAVDLTSMFLNTHVHGFPQVKRLLRVTTMTNDR